MKKKIFAFVLIAVVFAFPFRYAIIDPTPSFTVNLLSAVATVFGILIFFGLTFTNGKYEKQH